MVKDHLGFVLNSSTVQRGIFVPRYYDPEIPDRLAELEATHDLVLLGDLIDSGYIAVATGDEIGKMAYGTGDIPFVRTSDIASGEIVVDPKQGVSREIYEAYASKQGLRAGDVLFVRDGTYLVGQSCLVTEHDLPCLYQSHIIDFRVLSDSLIPVELCYACLNTPIVRRQIRAKQFTADIIDSIGNRFRELVLPVPKSRKTIEHVISEV